MFSRCGCFKNEHRSKYRRASELPTRQDVVFEESAVTTRPMLYPPMNAYLSSRGLYPLDCTDMLNSFPFEAERELVGPGSSPAAERETASGDWNFDTNWLGRIGRLHPSFL